MSEEKLIENQQFSSSFYCDVDQFLLNSNILLENNTPYHKAIPLLKILPWLLIKHRIKSELFCELSPPSFIFILHSLPCLLYSCHTNPLFLKHTKLQAHSQLRAFAIAAVPSASRASHDWLFLVIQVSAQMSYTQLCLPRRF